MQGARLDLFDARCCTLGEGAFWHPLRAQPFWFDILGQRLLSLGPGPADTPEPLCWQFDEPVSAAGWIDADHLLVASAGALLRLDLRDGRRERLVALEEDLPANRSNDGRADPMGGFWIGTMARDEAPGKGAIWRYWRGELHRLRAAMTIPNAICFAPDGRSAYFADTAGQTVWIQDLDAQGWPQGEARVFLDLRGSDQHPDGAVTDAQGNFWNARWGSGRLVGHRPDGSVLEQVALPARQPTCPAFAGKGLDMLIVTSAATGLDPATATTPGADGATWAVRPAARPVGRPEPAVIVP